MKKNVVYLFFLVSLISCNIYAPFQSNLGTQGILEEALKCYRNGDIACAISYYNQLSDGSLKSRQLCTAYMYKAGMGLSQLITTTQKSSGMLEALANELVPWSSTKGSDAASAVTHCTNYKTQESGGTNERESVLFKAISIFLDCATRIAKSDQINQSGNAGTCDNTSSTSGVFNNGAITKLDLDSDGGVDGDLAGDQGMCDSDATTCSGNLVGISGELSAAGFGNFNTFPAALAGAGAAAARAAIISDFTTD
ncbi:MAG: hypothetical protein H6617_08015 [Bdellovibrionaceae bacterium]|nr:hypothetical protein [Bdellovibrionales bacterium]MCB9254610.1 hypothetical protein [Pseudobdellovibrionaceae bacterium]